jgi:GAF domain-containing protein
VTEAVAAPNDGPQAVETFVKRLSARLEELRARSGPELALMVEDLESAQRVLEDAADELSTQREEFDGLVEVYEQTRLWEAEFARPTVASEEGSVVGEPTEMARVFSDMSKLPLEATSVHELLSSIARMCSDAVPAADGVTVTLGSPARPRELGSDNALAQALDGAQVLAGAGPSIEAWDGNVEVHLPHALVETRLPSRFVDAAKEYDVSGVLAIPIWVSDKQTGVLTCYTCSSVGFEDESIAVLRMFAESAGAVLHHVDVGNAISRLVDQMRSALESRATIEQAKGVIMTLKGCSSEEAFQWLATESQRTNVKLRELAAGIVASAEAGDQAALP